MSGLKQHFPEFGQAGGQVSQNEIDQYDLLSIDNPSNNVNWFGTASGTVTKALTQVNQNADWPRNFFYNVTGGTVGGTFTVNGIDQFGNNVSETVAVGTSASGQGVYGTAIFAKFLSGTVSVINTNTGTYAVGNGTASNGSAQSNWFGLLSKIAGTSDVKLITWINNGTPTTLNGGTAIGTLVSAVNHAFQGTSGVALTDHYKVVFKPSYDASASGTMSNL